MLFFGTLAGKTFNIRHRGGGKSIYFNKTVRGRHTCTLDGKGVVRVSCLPTDVITARHIRVRSAERSELANGAKSRLTWSKGSRKKTEFFRRPPRGWSFRFGATSSGPGDFKSWVKKPYVLSRTGVLADDGKLAGRNFLPPPRIPPSERHFL